MKFNKFRHAWVTTFNQDKTACTANLMRNSRHLLENYFTTSYHFSGLFKSILAIISDKQSIRNG